MEVSQTVILPFTMSVLWFRKSSRLCLYSFEEKGITEWLITCNEAIHSGLHMFRPLHTTLFILKTTFSNLHFLLFLETYFLTYMCLLFRLLDSNNVLGSAAANGR